MTAATTDPQPKLYRHRVYRGLATMWGLNFAHLLVALFLMKSNSSLAGGLFMLYYPLIALFYGAILLIAVRDYEGVFKGMVIALCVTLLLSCTCWVYVLSHLKF